MERHCKFPRDSLPIEMLLSAVSVGFCAAEFGISGGTYELPCTSAAKYLIPTHFMGTNIIVFVYLYFI
jgi:hypothetical protein